MKKSLLFNILIIIAFSWGGVADAKNISTSELTLLGRGWDRTEQYSVPFARVPARLVDLFADNESARGQSRCSSGLAFHFSTNSKKIGAVYTPWMNYSMPHQANTGTRGLDIYMFDSDIDEWVYMATHKPTADRVQNVDFTLVLDGSYHDFLIYLPTYDSVTDFTLVIDDAAQIRPADTRHLNYEKRVMVYGSSITQGGCCSRTGLLGSSILGRRLKCNVFNFGFSNGGRLDLGAAQIFSEIKNVAVYVIDAIGNSRPEVVEANLYNFVTTLMKANPRASFVFVEAINPNYVAYAPGYTGYTSNNERQREVVESLRRDYPGVAFKIISAAEITDPELEGKVDGVHFNDIGFMTWARAVAPVVKALLEKKSATSAPIQAVGETEVKPDAYFNIHGQRFDTPQPGLNIEVLSDGSARKQIH